ncbi:MAG: hypothetical protein AB7Q42_16975 [Acidimicrobiia bacterium]
MMTSTPTSSTAPAWRTTFELALLVSTVAVAVALALSWFIGVNEAPIVFGTVVAASIIGWRQPAARLHPARVRHLESSGPRVA